MPFEETAKSENKRLDRKLGDEWVDWDGTGQSKDTRTSPWVFVGLAGIVAVLYGVAGWILLWLITPRLQAVGWGGLSGVLAWIVAGYLLVWLLLLSLGTSGVKGTKVLLRCLGGIRWMIGPAIWLGKIFGFSRDCVAHAFIQVYNRFEILLPPIKEPQRLLLLLPRCLSREDMQQLRALRDKFGLAEKIAFGGTEARKAILEVNPLGIVAVACERDLLIGIKDLQGRIPVLAFCNQRPEGPCKNTHIDIAAIERAIRLFLGAARG